MKILIKDIYDTIPTLSPAQLRQVELRIKLLLKGTPPSNGEASIEPSSDWLLDGIKYELSRAGVASAHLPNFKVSSVSPTYPQLSIQVRKAVISACGRPLRPVELVSLGRAVAHALVLYLTRGDNPPPLSLRLLLTNVGKVMEAANYCFPGYATAGLLHWVTGAEETKEQAF